MIYRIVRMTFKEDSIEDFLQLFNRQKEKIRAFEGCEHLELWQDVNSKNIFSTYSHWQSQEHLDNYRHSELFGEVWPTTKSLFKEKPIAVSNKRLILL